MEDARPYLAACMVYRNHASYLLEWLEFHKLVGVERFFLYDNGSTDEHRRVLAPYLEEGSVVQHDWPGVLDMPAVFNDCLSRHLNDARWIAFLDVDEFLFSPTGLPVPQILVDYEMAPGIGVNWANFGTSGHVTRPPGLVTESYLYRNRSPRAGRCIKSVVDPTQVVRCDNAHYFHYRSGFAVDEQGHPITGPELYLTEGFSRSRLRINHYTFKSEEEYRAKISAWGEVGARVWGKPRPGDDRDETIQMYVPALRAAVASADERVAASLVKNSNS
jgi:hypothetical protein